MAVTFLPDWSHGINNDFFDGLKAMNLFKFWVLFLIPINVEHGPFCGCSLHLVLYVYMYVYICVYIHIAMYVSNGRDCRHGLGSWASSYTCALKTSFCGYFILATMSSLVNVLPWCKSSGTIFLNFLACFVLDRVMDNRCPLVSFPYLHFIYYMRFIFKSF